MTKIVQPIFRLEQRFIKFYERAVRREGDPEPEVFLRGQETRPLAAERSVYALAGLAQTLPGVPDLLADDNPLAACATTENGRRFLDALDAHLAEFGHQIYSFDPQLPTLADDPLPVVMAVRAHVQGKASPDARVAAMRRTATRRWPASRRVSVGESCDASANCWPWHSARPRCVRMRFSRWASRGRRSTGRCGHLGARLVAAGALDAAEDIFWLHWNEVRAAAVRLDAGEVPVIAGRAGTGTP